MSTGAPAGPGLDLRGRVILVLDGDAKSAAAVVRALGRAGARVLAASPSPGAPALSSKYVTARLACPHPIHEPEQLVEWIDATVARERPECTIPQTEYTVRLLDRHRDLFDGRTGLALPPHGAIPVAYDKGALLELAQSLGLDIPRTWSFQDLETGLSLADELPYPVYVKGRESYDSATEHPRFARGRVAHDPESYRALYAALHDISPLPIVQEAVPGTVVDVDGVWKDGRCGPVFCHRVHRSWPISGGYGTLHESLPSWRTPIEDAFALMRALRWTGVAQVQFVEDVRDGARRLLEINGRFWGFTSFAEYCGVDIVANTARVALGAAPGGATRYREHAWTRWLEGDAKRFYAALFKRGAVSRECLRVPGRLETFRDLVWDFRPGVHQDDLYLDDPTPWFVSQLRMAGLAARPWDPGEAPRS